MEHIGASDDQRRTVLERAFEAAQGGDWGDVRRFLVMLSGVPLGTLGQEVAEFLMDLFFWCSGEMAPYRAFPGPSRASAVESVDGLWFPLWKKMRKIFSHLLPELETRSYPLAMTAILGVPIPRSFRKHPQRTLWMSRFRSLRRRLLGNHPVGRTPNGLATEDEGHSPALTLSDLAHVWISGGAGRRRLPFRTGRFLHIGRVLSASSPQPASSGRWIFAAEPISESPRRPRHAVRRRRSSVESWGVLGSGAAGFLDELVEATAEELRAVRRLAEAVSHARRRVVLSLHNAASASCSGWAFDDVDLQFDDPRAGEVFVQDVRERLIAGKDSISDEKKVRRLWVAWQERLIKPKALHGLWEALGRFELCRGDEPSRATESFRDLFPATPVRPVVEEAPLAWSGWLAPHQHFSWRLLERWRREKRGLWFWGFRCLKALLREAQSRLDSGLAEALVIPWIDKFFISSKWEGDLGYLRMLLEWLRVEGLSPIVLFWEDTTRKRDPTLAVALGRHWPPSLFTGFGVFGNGSWTRREAEGVLTRTAEPGRLYVLRPFDDTHRPCSVEAVLQGRMDRRDFFSIYDSSWKDGTYAFYSGTQAAMLTSIATEPETIPPWVVTNGVRRPLGWYFRRALRQRVVKGGGDGRCRPVTIGLYARFANLL